VRAHTGREMNTHKKTWGTHKFSLSNVFAHILHVVLNIGECW